MEHEAPSLKPRLFSFLVQLHGEEGFFPASAFASTPESAKEQIQERFGRKIAVFKDRKFQNT
jgi:hypothetical protein